MNARLIPEGGENPYADHPGFEAQGCALQYTVTPSRMGSTSSHGFGCGMTGGHCVPDQQCDARRSRCAERDRLQELFKQCDHAIEMVAP